VNVPTRRTVQISLHTSLCGAACHSSLCSGAIVPSSIYWNGFECRGFCCSAMGRKTAAFALSLFVAPVISSTGNTSDFKTHFSIAGERYYEDLVIQPLRDGRVISTFTFTTLLEGVSPRDPWDLETPGERKLTRRFLCRALGCTLADACLHGS
jgi:hypothetical protein